MERLSSRRSLNVRQEQNLINSKHIQYTKDHKGERNNRPWRLDEEASSCVPRQILHLKVPRSFASGSSCSGLVRDPFQTKSTKSKLISQGSTLTLKSPMLDPPWTRVKLGMKTGVLHPNHRHPDDCMELKNRSAYGGDADFRPCLDRR